jgi:cytochrome b561
MSATAEGRRAGTRYSTVSIALHWTLAVLIVGQIAAGLWFADLPRGPTRTGAFLVHVSLGMTILVLSLVRLAWRLTHPPPPLPADYSPAIRGLARATHVGLYVVMIGMPLSGWAMLSANGRPLPDLWYAIPFPRLPVLGHDAHETAESIHTGALLWFAFAALALHVAGALKHHLVDRDTTLWRMLPWVRPRSTRGLR